MNRHRHFREPAWHGRVLPGSKMPPKALQPWLLDGSSLTRRLQARCPDQFRVEVLSERRERPQLSEAKLLSISPRHLARVREVFLCCGNARWVFARTVIPFASLRGPNRRLLHLGSRPLGAFLFAHPRLQRGPLQMAGAGRLPGGERAGDMFGRRSLFRLHGRALLVSEFFLPAFLESIAR